MISIQDGRMISSGTMMMILSLSIGSLIGEWINLVFENTRIKVANMLPAIFVAVAWAFLPF